MKGSWREEITRIFEQMMCFIGFPFGKDCETGILVFHVCGVSYVYFVI
jgi:hypothetical protein